MTLFDSHQLGNHCTTRKGYGATDTSSFVWKYSMPEKFQCDLDEVNDWRETASLQELAARPSVKVEIRETVSPCLSALLSTELESSELWTSEVESDASSSMDDSDSQEISIFRSWQSRVLCLGRRSKEAAKLTSMSAPSSASLFPHELFDIDKDEILSKYLQNFQGHCRNRCSSLFSPYQRPPGDTRPPLTRERSVSDTVRPNIFCVTQQTCIVPVEDVLLSHLITSRGSIRAYSVCTEDHVSVHATVPPGSGLLPPEDDAGTVPPSRSVFSSIPPVGSDCTVLEAEKKGHARTETLMFSDKTVPEGRNSSTSLNNHSVRMSRKKPVCAYESSSDMKRIFPFGFVTAINLRIPSDRSISRKKESFDPRSEDIDSVPSGLPVWAKCEVDGHAMTGNASRPPRTIQCVDNSFNPEQENPDNVSIDADPTRAFRTELVPEKASEPATSPRSDLSEFTFDSSTAENREEMVESESNVSETFSLGSSKITDILQRLRRTLSFASSSKELSDGGSATRPARVPPTPDGPKSQSLVNAAPIIVQKLSEWPLPRLYLAKSNSSP